MSRTTAWLIWVITSIFYGYQYILRVMPNIMMGDIMEGFHLSEASFGQFSGIYYIGYSLMQIPLGIMLDRFGPKKVMTSCILLSVVGLLPLIYADDWIYPIIGRLLVGIGSSAAILGVFKIVRMTFSEKQFPRMVSLAVTIGVMGAIWGGGPISYMKDLFGFESVIQLLAVMGLALAAVTYFIAPGDKEESSGSVISDIKEVFCNKKVMLCCFFAGLMVGPLEGFADGWSTLFLERVSGFEGIYAASLPSMIYIGMCFGAPLLSLFADRVGYLLTIFFTGSVMTVSFMLLLMGVLPVSLISVIFTVIGIASAYQVLAIYKASTFVRESTAGLTTALANMIIMLFGYAFHSMIGLIVSSSGGKMNTEALILGISVVPVALFIGSAGFFALFLMERRQERKVLNY